MSACDSKASFLRHLSEVMGRYCSLVAFEVAGLVASSLSLEIESMDCSPNGCK